MCIESIAVYHSGRRRCKRNKEEAENIKIGTLEIGINRNYRTDVCRWYGHSGGHKGKPRNSKQRLDKNNHEHKYN